MPFCAHDGLEFHYRVAGEGVPFYFQHGLGGDVNQPFGLVEPPAGFQLIAFDCRGHGRTRPLGDEGKLALGVFADDLRALQDQLGQARAIVGGISMGAAVTLNFALRWPERVLGLILSRPAWVDEPFPPNTQVYPQIASLIRSHGPVEGAARFRESPEYQRTLAESPDAARSLLGQFSEARAVDAVARLERIPREMPSPDRRDWARITVPTLVLGNRQDPIHPFEYVEIAVSNIPGARLQEITPKSVSVARHEADVRGHISAWLRSHW